MKSDTAPEEECYAVFVGKDGEDCDLEYAAIVFEVGKSYRVTSGIMYRWNTVIELDGVEGEWNSRLFTVDLSGVPLRKEFGFPQPRSAGRVRRNRIVLMVGIFLLLAAVLLWIWAGW